MKRGCSSIAAAEAGPRANHRGASSANGQEHIGLRVDTPGGHRHVARLPAPGEVAEWLKAADCKSARASVRWFESSPLHQHPDQIAEIPKTPDVHMRTIRELQRVGQVELEQRQGPFPSHCGNHLGIGKKVPSERHPSYLDSDCARPWLLFQPRPGVSQR